MRPDKIPLLELIAARSEIRQAGLEKMLVEINEFRTAGICASTATLEERARQLMPDLVVVDCEAESDAGELTAALGRVAANITSAPHEDPATPELQRGLGNTGNDKPREPATF
jgi:AmiR/NasT family two-component response regulator